MDFAINLGMILTFVQLRNPSSAAVGHPYMNEFLHLECPWRSQKKTMFFFLSIMNFFKAKMVGCSFS